MKVKGAGFIIIGQLKVILNNKKESDKKQECKRKDKIYHFFLKWLTLVEVRHSIQLFECLEL